MSLGDYALRAEGGAASEFPERTLAPGEFVVVFAGREVWASLWSARAYDEREFGLIYQSRVATGVPVLRCGRLA